MLNASDALNVLTFMKMSFVGWKDEINSRNGDVDMAAASVVERQWRSAKIRDPLDSCGCETSDPFRKRPTTAHPPHPSIGKEVVEEEEEVEAEEQEEQEEEEEEEEEIAEEIDLIRDIDIGSSDSINFFG